MKKIKIPIIRESKQKFIKENMEQALDSSLAGSIS